MTDTLDYLAGIYDGKTIYDTPTPKVTVLVLARDEQANIRRTLELLYAQDMPPYRVVLVDDGSTDDTADIARSFPIPSGYPPIEIISREPHESYLCSPKMALTINAGLDVIRDDTTITHVLVTLNGDTLLSPNYIRTVTTHMIADGSVIGGGCITPDDVSAPHDTGRILDANFMREYMDNMTYPQADGCESYPLLLADAQGYLWGKYADAMMDVNRETGATYTSQMYVNIGKAMRNLNTMPLGALVRSAKHFVRSPSSGLSMLYGYLSFRPTNDHAKLDFKINDAGRIMRYAGEPMWLYLGRNPRLFKWYYRLGGHRTRKFRVLTASLRRLPDFNIIGAAKSGTTTLYDCLMTHPDIMPCWTKEPHYFNHPIRFGEWSYRCNFPIRPDAKLSGESSVSYLTYPGVPARMYRVLPNAKIIVLLRDPVERAYSQYNYGRKVNQVPYDTFEEALAREHTDMIRWLRAMSLMQTYLHTNQRVTKGNLHTLKLHWNEGSSRAYRRSGLYALHLKRWFEHYPREQFLILSTADMHDDRQATLDKVFEHIGAEPFDIPEDVMPNSNVGKYKQPMKEKTRDYLIEYFKPYNKQLYELLGRDFGWGY